MRRRLTSADRLADGWIYQPATIYQVCAVFGLLETEVRAFKVHPVSAYAQYPVSVRVSFLRPRKRRASSYLITPDNLRYLQILDVSEYDDPVLYDSRRDVPCDLDAWRATASRFGHFRVSHDQRTA